MKYKTIKDMKLQIVNTILYKGTVKYREKSKAEHSSVNRKPLTQVWMWRNTGDCKIINGNDEIVYFSIRYKLVELNCEHYLV